MRCEVWDEKFDTYIVSSGANVSDGAALGAEFIASYILALVVFTVGAGAAAAAAAADPGFDASDHPSLLIPGLLLQIPNTTYSNASRHTSE